MHFFHGGGHEITHDCNGDSKIRYTSFYILTGVKTDRNFSGKRLYSLLLTTVELE